MLGVAPLDSSRVHGAPGGHTNALAPVNQPLGRPLHVRAVGRRQVLATVVKPPLWALRLWAATRWPRCSNSTTVCRDAQLHHLPDQGLRHAVTVPIELDVVVDVHAHGPEHRELPGLQRQRLQCRCIQISANALARLPGSFWNRLAVELVQQRDYGLVDDRPRWQTLVAQAHQIQRSTTCTPILLWLCPAGGVGGRAAPRCRSGAQSPATVSLARAHTGWGWRSWLGVVGHDELGHAAKEGQGPWRNHPASRPWSRAAWHSEGIARRTQCRHKDVGTAAIGEAHRGAGKVDEQLLAGAVDLAHRALEASWHSDGSSRRTGCSGGAPARGAGPRAPPTAASASCLCGAVPGECTP
jgi:hypothetical protein